MFLGPFDEAKWGKLPDMVSFEKIAMAPLVAFMIFFGIYPTPILNIFNSATTALLSSL